MLDLSLLKIEKAVIDGLVETRQEIYPHLAAGLTSSPERRYVAAKLILLKYPDSELVPQATVALETLLPGSSFAMLALPKLFSHDEPAFAEAFDYLVREKPYGFIIFAYEFCVDSIKRLTERQNLPFGQIPKSSQIQDAIDDDFKTCEFGRILGEALTDVFKQFCINHAEDFYRLLLGEKHVDISEAHDFLGAVLNEPGFKKLQQIVDEYQVEEAQATRGQFKP